MPSIQVAIVDDHPVVLDGISYLLSEMEGIEVWGTALGGKEFFKQLKEKKSIPDVCLLDICMPNMDGMEVLNHLQNTYKDVRIILFSQFHTKSMVHVAIKGGASSYLLKCSDVDELEAAVRCVYNGDFYFDGVLSKKKFLELKSQQFRLSDFDHIPFLSEREKEVLILMGGGYTHKEIAAKLHLSKRTIDAHRDRIFNKLGCNKVSEAVTYASNLGWLA